MIYRVIWGLGH